MRLRVCSLLLLFMATSINCGEEGPSLTKSPTNGGAEDKKQKNERKKKVLIYNPHLGYYHTKFMSTIANLLDEASYDVTMLDSLIYTNLPRINRNPGIHVLKVNQNPETKVIVDNGETKPDGLAAFWGEQPIHKQVEGFFGFYRKNNNFDNMLAYQCGDVLESKAFKSLMNTHFDLLITEVFDLCGLGLFDRLKSGRVIITSSVPFHEYFEYKLGLPSNDSVPTKFSLKTLDIHHGINSTFVNGLQSALFGQNMFGYLEKAETEVFKSSINFETLMKKAYLLLENVHPLLDWSEKKVNGIISIGGITVTPKRDLKTIEKEIDDRLTFNRQKEKKNVLVSFGTVMKHKNMAANTIKNLISAFKSVPEAVFFWKVDPEALKDLKDLIPNNVIAHKWLQQNEILFSKKVDLFVSHMGIGSYTEAAYAGVPLVAVPIFVDQHYNYACAKKLGIAHWVDKNSLATSSDELGDAIRKALFLENRLENATTLATKLEEYGDQRENMMNEIAGVLLQLESDETPFSSNNRDSSDRNRSYYVAYYAVPSVIFIACFCMFFAIFPLICYISTRQEDLKRKIMPWPAAIAVLVAVAVLLGYNAELVYKTIPDFLNEYDLYADYRVIFVLIIFNFVVDVLYVIYGIYSVIYWIYSLICSFLFPQVQDMSYSFVKRLFVYWCVIEFIVIFYLCRWFLLKLIVFFYLCRWFHLYLTN